MSEVRMTKDEVGGARRQLGIRHWLVIICPLFLAGLVVGLGTRGLLVLVGLLAAVGLLAYPEVSLLLFLTAGTFKAEISRLMPDVPDPTVVLAGIVAAAVLSRLLRTTGSLSKKRAPRAETSDQRPDTAHFVTLAWAYGALLFIVVSSALSLTATDYGRDKALRFATLTTLATVAPYFLIDTETRLARFLIAAVALGGAMTVLGTVTGEGLAAFGATHIATGRVIGLGLIGAGYFFLGVRRRLRRWLVWAPLAGVLLFGFLYSGSRGSLLSLGATLVVIVLLAFAFQRGRRMVLTGLAGCAVLAVVVTASRPEAVEVMNRRLNYVAEGPLTTTAGTRVRLAQAAFETFGANPLTGVGIGGFDLAWSLSDRPRGQYPHNIFLEVASELGVIGLASLVLLILLGFRNAFRAFRVARGESLRAAVLVIAIASYFLVNALFSGDLNDNRMLFAAVGLCVSRLLDVGSPTSRTGRTGGND